MLRMRSEIKRSSDARRLSSVTASEGRAVILPDVLVTPSGNPQA
jgi:hypothetical protein